MDISFRTQTCILGALAIATVLSAQSSTPIQLPASGRGLQPGSVGTTQSTVNAGGQNSVNLIDSSVNIQGSYLGSVPTGTATDKAISLSLPEALRRALLKSTFALVGRVPHICLTVSVVPGSH